MPSMTSHMCYYADLMTTLVRPVYEANVYFDNGNTIICKPRLSGGRITVTLQCFSHTNDYHHHKQNIHPHKPVKLWIDLVLSVVYEV